MQLRGWEHLFRNSRDKLRCAHLLHLAPGKTSHYGGPTFNYVSEKSRDFLPNSVQVELHYARHLDSRGGLVAWYRARKGKPLYELQIEVCQWAIKTVEDARGAAEEPKKQFIAAVKKQIESLRRTGKPAVNNSPWASPMSSEAPWKFYTMESMLYERDWVLRQKSDMTEYYKWIDSKERKQLVEQIKARRPRRRRSAGSREKAGFRRHYSRSRATAVLDMALTPGQRRRTRRGPNISAQGKRSVALGS